MSPVGSTAAFCATILLLAAGTACGPRAPAMGAETAVSVETAALRDVPIVVELPGRTEATATIEIRANVEGRLTEMSFQEGRLIQKGQMLFRIDPRRYDAALQSAAAVVEKAQADVEMAQEQQHLVNAQSALRQAEANLLKCNQDVERLKPLAARRAVPQRDLDAAVAAQSSAAAAVEDARATVRTTTVSDRMGLRQAQAGLTAAEAAFDTAKLDRAETEIRAPIAGLIGRSQVSAGNYVGHGEASRLVTISQVDPINIVFGIPETVYLRTVNTVQTEELQHIDLILSDNSAYSSRGHFTNLAGGVDEKTGALLAVAQFPNPKAFLLPGMTAKVRFTAGTRKGAVLVSESAVFDLQGAKAVYVAAAGNRVDVRRVAIDGSYQGKSVVTGGLSGGETVIVAGNSKLRPGQLVTIRPARTGPPQGRP
jgi:membrane fusion protein, multidrug efflux system